MQTDGVVIIGIWWWYSVSRNGSVSMIPAAAAISGKSDVFSGRHTPSFHTLSAAKPTSQHATPRKNSEAIFSYMSASTKLLCTVCHKKPVTLFIGTIKFEVWLLSITK